MENTKDSDKEKGGNKKKFELSFKSIHEQAKEKVEEKLIADQKKKDQGNDNGLDEKVLNVLMPDETFDEDDFYYFQYFGAKRLESTSKAVNQDKLDVEKFKELRSKIIIKPEDKPQPVFLAKEETEVVEKKKPSKLPIKVVSNAEKVADTNQNKTNDTKKDRAGLVDYSSDEEDEKPKEKIQKKVKAV